MSGVLVPAFQTKSFLKQFISFFFSLAGFQVKNGEMRWEDVIL